jgi:hypothetical protein
MKQQSLAVAADRTFEQYRKPTRREVFLKTMEFIVPWAALCEVIRPYYPKAGNGRPHIGLERMLRIHFVQHWFNLADHGLAHRSLPAMTHSTRVARPTSMRNAYMPSKQTGWSPKLPCLHPVHRVHRHSTVTAPNQIKEVQAMIWVREGVRHSATTRNTL